MKKVRLLIIGGGGRGTIYARHALHLPETEVAGVAEPRDFFRDRIGDMHHIPAENRVRDWRELLDRPRFADGVVITTQDRMHVEPAAAFARMGYHILLEKPMAPDEAGCRTIAQAVRENHVMLALAHVMRYMNVTRAIRKVIQSGTIGSVVSIQLLEPVGHWRFAHSYVRGNWRREAESSSVLLAKSIHDLDWVCYLMDSPAKRVSSFGSLMYFKRANQPEGAADRCTECCYAETCPYSAPRFYTDRIRRGLIDNYVESVTGNCTVENMLEVLRTSPYGRCVFACDNDVADHQEVNVEFAGGATASFTLAGCSRYDERQTVIFGSWGELQANGNEVTLYTYFNGETSRIPVPPAPEDDRHNGGDFHLLEAFVNAVRTGDETDLVSSLDPSLASHMLIFAAERSRHENRTVSMEEMQ